MRKTMLLVLMVMAIMLVASPVYAQGGAAGGSTANWSLAIGAGLGMGIAAGLCGIGQGRATGSAVEAMARNPGARPGIFIFLLIGLALIESLALYALLISFQITGKM